MTPPWTPNAAYLLPAQHASAAHPLRIALDGLEQLSDEAGGRTRLWDWLPPELPPHVTLVVSTLSEEPARILAQARTCGRAQGNRGEAPPGRAAGHRRGRRGRAATGAAPFRWVSPPDC